MNDYELVIVAQPDAEAKLKELVEAVSKAVTGAKGKVDKSEAWGRRDLAFPIGKLNEGVYHYMELSLPSEEAPRIERRVKAEEKVIRHLMIRK